MQTFMLCKCRWEIMVILCHDYSPVLYWCIIPTLLQCSIDTMGSAMQPWQVNHKLSIHVCAWRTYIKIVLNNSYLYLYLSSRTEAADPLIQVCCDCYRAGNTCEYTRKNQDFWISGVQSHIALFWWDIVAGTRSNVLCVCTHTRQSAVLNV